MLRSCRARYFRSFTQLSWEPDAAFNSIIGSNASGKTSALEVVSLLASGRSSRTALLREAIQHGQPCFYLHGSFATQAEQTEVQLDRCAHSRKFWVNGQAVHPEALLGAIPLLAISPNTHREFLTEASIRRRFLYWGMFHMEHPFLARWRDYGRVLAQRNAQLRRHDGTTSVWDVQLAEHGQWLAELAQQYVTRLLPLFMDTLVALGLRDDSIALRLFRGWDDGEPMAVALTRAKSADRALKRTTCGFHRADLQISVNGVRAVAFASYGQQKTIVAALCLAQMKLLLTDRPAAIFLFDDLPADWDRSTRQRVLTTIAALNPVQTFITATEADLIPERPGRTFHVEQGRLCAI